MELQENTIRPDSISTLRQPLSVPDRLHPFPPAPDGALPEMFLPFRRSPFEVFFTFFIIIQTTFHWQNLFLFLTHKLRTQLFETGVVLYPLDCNPILALSLLTYLSCALNQLPARHGSFSPGRFRRSQNRFREAKSFLLRQAVKKPVSEHRESDTFP